MSICLSLHEHACVCLCMRMFVCVCPTIYNYVDHWQQTALLNPKGVTISASFQEGPHCLLVQSRSSEREKRISMLRWVRLRIFAYPHLNVRYID